MKRERVAIEEVRALLGEMLQAAQDERRPARSGVVGDNVADLDPDLAGNRTSTPESRWVTDPAAPK